MGFSKVIGSIAYSTKKHAPEIFIVSGIISGAAALVLTAKATPKAIEAKEKYKNDQNCIKDALESGETVMNEPYTLEDYNQDVKINTSKYVLNTVKTYAPAAICYAASIACFLASFGIMKKRLAGAVALMTVTTNAFDQYRQRVRDDQGEDKDKEYYTGMKPEKVKTKEIGEDGKEHTVTQTVWNLDPGLDDIPFLSPYSIVLNPRNTTWKLNSGDPIYMTSFLKIMQSQHTLDLQRRGWLTLDQVLEDLRFDFCQYPEIDQNVVRNVGWLATKNSNGDGFVDYGCWDKNGNLMIQPGPNGYIILDFNCDGWIQGKIPTTFRSSEEIKEACEKYPEIEK